MEPMMVDGELRDEMKRRRTSPLGGDRNREHDRRVSGASAATVAAESEEDFSSMKVQPLPDGSGSSEAQAQATRLCPPFLERGRPAPASGQIYDRGSAAATARELTRKEQSSDAAQ